ncbi:MAG: exodeoxyribonuclease V subunit gamma [Firmicutes bacterium]|nr:exodeoxyribonuclease V subunit gamma [Bacillota bacterium]
MIQLHYGSIEYEIDRFMYESIASAMPSDTILLVPDPFTLQAEEDALKYMRADVLMNLEIMSPGGFGRRVLGSTGSPAGIPVNRYGRFMLLLDIINGIGTAEEGVFSDILRTGIAGRTALAHMVSDEISELKQFGIGPEDLKQIAEEFDEGILRGKLFQTADIYSAYQARLRGRFNDSDDLQAEVAARIPGYRRVAGCAFWIYGFDYMSPDMMEMVCAVSRQAPELHIVLTGERSGEEEFDMFQRMTAMVRSKCAEYGESYQDSHVPDRYYRKLDADVRIVKAGGFYEEAETIAADIMELVRDQALRFRDIAVICNDLEVRGQIIGRVFEQYGIPLFMDRKRSVKQEAAVEFITALIDCVSGRMQFEDVFRMLRTGFSPLTDEECDLLEIYCSRYHIKGGRWRKPFTYGESRKDQSELEEINRMRASVCGFIDRFEEFFRGKETVREKTAALYLYLAEVVQMPEKLERCVADMENKRLFSHAAAAAQIWKVIVDIMDQMVEVMGDRAMSDEEYGEILKEGFREVEIGIIPSTADQVILGNMHRTRTGSISALFAAGANDGVLPEEAADEGIFSDLEKDEIARVFRKPVGRTGMIRGMEQDLAIYRNLGRAGRQLTISWSAQDQNGGELRPSVLVSRYLRRFGSGIEEKSAAESGDGMRLIQTRRGLIPHLAQVFRKAEEDGTDPPDEWKAAALAAADSPVFLNMKKGLYYSRRSEKLERETVRQLYGKGSASQEIVLSPSRMEKYVHCPFSYFIQYGLAPAENRSFDVDSRSVGDIFHYCMKRTAADLTEEGVPVSDPLSRWMTVTEAELREAISRYVEDFSVSYRDGVFLFSGREHYIRKRVEEVIFLNASVMIDQVRRGRVRAVYFESGFGRAGGNAFPPVKLLLADGGAVYIEGIIDRVDTFRGKDEEDPSNYVRIVDYKTGGDRFNADETKAGIRLQLILYLEAAMGGIENARPAGVFYFPAGEKTEDITGKTAEDGRVYETNMRLDGVLVKKNDIIEGMDSTIGVNEESQVIPVRRSGDEYNNLRNAHRAMESEEFDDMLKGAGSVIQEAAESLAGGCVDAAPGRSGSFDACRYCGYGSICHIKITGGNTR